MDTPDLSSVFHSGRKHSSSLGHEDFSEPAPSAFANADFNMREPLLAEDAPSTRSGDMATCSSLTTKLLINAYSSRKLSAKLRAWDASLLGQGDRSVWAWLEPGTRVLPHVVLWGDGIAIGRGSEAFAARKSAADAPATLGLLQTDGLQGSESYAFVEVPDGRVSRLHCTISRKVNLITGLPEPALQDLSSNGTFINGKKVPINRPVFLNDGDRISLVLSVTPLVEQFFIFHTGDNGVEAATPSSDASSEQASPLAGRTNPYLQRMSTNQYTTVDKSCLDDLQCQICLGTLQKCVALEPCGHNFCAVCLSHFFSSLLQSGQPISCPLRCSAPSRIVKNQLVRDLVDRLGEFVAKPKKSISLDRAISHSTSAIEPPPLRHCKSHSLSQSQPITESTNEELPDYDIHPLCPLYDDLLPMDATGLKSKQLLVALEQLKQPQDMAPQDVMNTLESLARLSWSDDEVRKDIADNQGIESIINCMTCHSLHEGVQCNGCLAIMALVRGEGEVCVHNQWRLAKNNGVNAIKAAMRNFKELPMVQLSALLCIIPLSLENHVMQAHVTSILLPDIVCALRMHPQEVDIQAKGLVALGVMAQGEDVIHDAIRQLQIDAGVPAAVMAVLQSHGRYHDEALWAALFSLAVLVREGADASDPTARAMAAAGVVRELKACMKAYKDRVSGSEDTADEMIVTAGEFLQKILEPAEQKWRSDRGFIMGLAAVIPLSCVVGAAALRYLYSRMV